MSNTLEKPSKSTSKAKPLAAIPDVLSHVSLADTLVELDRLDRHRHLIPTAARGPLRDLAEEVVAKGEFIGLTNAVELVSKQALLLKALTGVEHLNQFHNTAVADELHRYRNTMLTLALVAAGSIHGNPTGLYQRMIKLQPRTHALRRPLTDDEILLARVAVHLVSRDEPTSVTAAVYTLVETGFTPGETTMFSLDDVDDYEMPELVVAAGNGQLASRFLPVDTYGRVVLGRFTEAAYKKGQPTSKSATYAGRKHAPGSSAATASAQGIIDRFLKELGLFNVDVSATSLRLWRIAATLAETDTATAQERAGYDDTRNGEDRLWRSLGFFEKPRNEDADDEPEESFL
jgi:hypothetical protein